jgi:4-amino-4-deoxy-L-arabinose transferase-like glycosyltransferase
MTEPNDPSASSPKDAPTEPASASEPATDAGSATPPETSSDEASASAAPVASEGDGARDGGDKSPTKKDGLLRGNPLNKWKGGVTAGIGAVLAYLFMAYSGQLRLGVPLGTLCIAISTFGVMDLLGTFDDPEEYVETRTTLSALGWPLAQVVSSMLLYCATLMGAQSGLWSQWGWGVLVTASFLAMVVSLFELGVKLGPWAKDEDGLARPIYRRHGFWVIVTGALLYMPALGVFSLWDPWETHYGEVAREILARNDWISIWWAQDGWFWSKPILNFWIQAIAMATLGTHYQPDRMLTGYAGGLGHPEWVVRTPNVLFALLAMYVLYKGVAKVFGRRAGLVGGIVLATCPDWLFLAHQTMADMPFVAPMTTAMGLLLLGLHTDEARRVRVYEVKAGSRLLRFSGWHLVFGIVLMVSLPQILYLFSRNLELVLGGSSGAHGFRLHWDEFRSGSGMGNCGLPGNEVCVPAHPASVPKHMPLAPENLVQGISRYVLAFEPSLQALVWAALLGTLLYLNWGERRAQRLYYLAAWFFAAIATMAKGPAGFALPILCALTYLATKRRWSEFTRLELVSGLLIILVVGMPWYVAMYVRHGAPFTDRLIFHDMWNRAFSHVHDTNEGDDTSLRYYAWQLGYALFPWTGLVPLGLVYWLRRGDASGRGRGDVSIFLFMWLLFSFTLFSLMGTKFHHYIFPAVPPAAMLVGVTLDDMLGKVERPRAGWPATVSLYLGGALLAIVALTALRGGSFFGTGGGALGLGAAGALLVAGYFILPMLPLARAADVPAAAPALMTASPTGELAMGDTALATPPPLRSTGMSESTRGEEEEATLAPRQLASRRTHENILLGAAAVGGALLIVLVGRDLVIKPDGADQPGAIRLLQLFTYNYRRPWPDNLDFSAVLGAFTIASALAAFVFGAVARLRQRALFAFFAVAIVWGAWGVDAYMARTAQHWGQHEVIEAYYANRTSPDQQLVAYQMNWKGENFYTGNRIPAFVSSGATFTTWLKQQREKGHKVMFFITEHSRVGGLRNELGAKSMRELTDRKLCNKFVLVRAEL